MKKFLPAALAALAFTAIQPAVAHAQHTDPHSRFRSAHGLHSHHLPFSVGYNAMARSAARTTSATGSRLIQVADLTGDTLTSSYVITDSAVLTYAGSNGLAADPYDWDGYADDDGTDWKYSSGVDYSYNTSTSSYTNGSIFSQTFDANDNIISDLSQDWDTSTSTYVNAYQNFYTYDGFNNMLTEIYQTWDTTYWYNDEKNIFTYTASNKVATLIYQDSASGGWQNNEKIVFTYDGSDNLVSYTEYSWLSSGVWGDPYKYTCSYTSGNLTGLLAQGYDSTSAAWVNNGNTLYSNFAGSQPQTIIYQYWNGTAWINSGQYTYTYNSYGQPTTLYYRDWNTTTSSWYISQYDNGERLYYETYNTAVPALASVNGNAVVYPNPASAELNIKITWNDAQAFTVSITDMLGRVVSGWAVPSCAAYEATIPVNNVAAGNYVLNIKGTNGSIVQKITIEK